MTLSDFFSFCSLIIGFFSSIYFGIGAFKISRVALWEIAVLFYGKGFRVALEMIGQKYDYITGASLLAISFLFQVVSKSLGSSLEVSIFLKSYGMAFSFAVLISGILITSVRCFVCSVRSKAIDAFIQETKDHL
jgi:hypothetical protein